MKEDIQTLSDVGWDGLDLETKTRLKKSYPIDLLQSVSDSGWESISDETKNQIRTIFNKPSESPSEMRARAKAEFASDWLAQKKLEAESIRETPVGKVASALFPRSVDNEIFVRGLESELVVCDSSEYVYVSSNLDHAYMKRTTDSLYIPLGLMIFLFLYFLPSYISWKRGVSRKKILMILFLNLFAGWTFVVWLVLGIWSLSDLELK